MTEAPVRGRPRDPQADESIIDATLALLTEDGFDRLSMDAVAARAGVGKATIYRRWSSKEALVIDAVARRSDPMPVLPSGSTHDRLVALVTGIVTRSRTGVGRLLPCMVGASVSNPTLAEHYRREIMAPRRAKVAEILREGIGRGELRADLDIEGAIDQIVGPVLYRIVFGGGERVRRSDCVRLVDLTLQGLAAR